MSSNDQWGVGDKALDKAFDRINFNGQKVDLIFGEHPHSRSDNNIYARFPSGHVEAFDGKRVLTKVEIEDINYLKQSGLSGNEIRSGGSAKIFFDGIQCHEFFHRDTRMACLKAYEILNQYLEHSSQWAIKSQREKLVGKKIYYKEQPAVIESLIEPQGCLILRGDFKAPVYDLDRGPSEEVKVEVLDPHIWWFRE